jgi:hypothetical protein
MDDALSVNLRIHDNIEILHRVLRDAPMQPGRRKETAPRPMAADVL